MSTVTILAGDTTHVTTTNLQAAMQSAGHTVTVRPTTDVDTALAAITASDLVCFVRGLLANVSVDGGRIKTLMGVGKPLLLSPLAGGSPNATGTSGNTDSAVVAAGLASSYTYRDNATVGVIRDTVSHPSVAGQSRNLQQYLAPVGYGTGYHAALAGPVGSRLIDDGVPTIGTGDPIATAINPGTANIQATATASARVIVSSLAAIYGSAGALATPLNPLLGAEVEWLLKGNPTYGAAAPVSGQFLPRS